MESNNRNFIEFHKICSSLVAGIIRLHEARIVTSAAKAAIINAKVEGVANGAKHTDFDKISSREYENFSYVTISSYLVYATALFDTFITDVMKYLIYLNPGPYKSDLTLKFSDCEKAENVHMLRKLILDKKIRSLSYDTFNNRIKEFKRSYGLKLDITAAELSLLEKVSGIRNALSHDLSFIDVSFDSSGQIIAKQSRCPNKPINVTREIFEEAWSVYMSISKKVYVAVCTQVIKDVDQELFDWLVSQLGKES